MHQWYYVKLRIYMCVHLYAYIYIYMFPHETCICISLHWRHYECDVVSNHRRLDCLLNRWFRHRSEKISMPHVTGLCEGNPPVTGGFPSQRTSNAENVSIWWRHNVNASTCTIFLLHSYNNLFTVMDTTSHKPLLPIFFVRFDIFHRSYIAFFFMSIGNKGYVIISLFFAVNFVWYFFLKLLSFIWSATFYLHVS